MKFSTFPVKKFLVLFTILAFPCALYYFLKEKGENRYRPLTIYGPKEVASTFHTKRGAKIPDTVYHKIRDFDLVDQNGNEISFPADSNQITIVNFFFSRCPTFCDGMNREMGRVASVYKGNRLLRFLTITVDPDYDQPGILKQYSEKYVELNPKWHFLTGDKKLIYSIAREDFLLDAIEDSVSEGKFIHSSMLVLVDPQKRIRGYYDSTGGADRTNLLIDEIKLLINEELRSIKIENKKSNE